MPADADQAVVLRARHKDALDRAAIALCRAHGNLVSISSVELGAEDVREALDALGELTGTTISDDLLDRIFSEFCIGK